MVRFVWPCLMMAGIIRRPSHSSAVTGPGQVAFPPVVQISSCLSRRISRYQWQRQSWQCLCFLVVQLFANQVEGKMYIYELYGPNYFLAETIILRVTLGSVEFWASTIWLWHVEGTWMNLSDEWDGANRERQGHIKKMGNPIPLGSLMYSSPTLSGSFGFLLYSLGPLSLPL